jgi:hypothetical protein
MTNFVAGFVIGVAVTNFAAALLWHWLVTSNSGEE